MSLAPNLGSLAAHLRRNNDDDREKPIVSPSHDEISGMEIELSNPTPSPLSSPASRVVRNYLPFLLLCIG